MFAERVQRELENEIFPRGTGTVSAGVAELEAGMGSPELLGAAADQALYAATEAGRNRCSIAGSRIKKPVGTAVCDEAVSGAPAPDGTAPGEGTFLTEARVSCPKRA